jgi:hypothetical protein
VHTFEVARKEKDGVARVASPLDAHNFAREFARVPKRSSHSPFFQLPGLWPPHQMSNLAIRCLLKPLVAKYSLVAYLIWINRFASSIADAWGCG